MAEDDGIILHHKGIDSTIEAKTEAQAAVYAESGWEPATKAQRQAFLEAQAAEAEGLAEGSEG